MYILYGPTTMQNNLLELNISSFTSQELELVQKHQKSNKKSN